MVAIATSGKKCPQFLPLRAFLATTKPVAKGRCTRGPTGIAGRARKTLV
jgi:hypothetical protein